MVSKRETLKILQKEYEYEDQLMKDLANFYIYNLKNIPDLSEREKKILIEKLTQIKNESEGHRNSFNELIKYVTENGADNY